MRSIIVAVEMDHAINTSKSSPTTAVLVWIKLLLGQDITACYIWDRCQLGFDEIGDAEENRRLGRRSGMKAEKGCECLGSGEGYTGIGIVIMQQRHGLGVVSMPSDGKGQ